MNVARNLLTVVGSLVLVAGTRAQETAKGSIAGTVRGPNGAPVGRARLYLAREVRPRWPGTFAEREGKPSAVTDERGRYRVDQLAPGEYYLAAWAPGFAVGEYGADTEWQERFAVRVRGEEHVSGMDLRLQRPFWVRGRVLGLDGAGLRGVGVSVTVDYHDGEGGNAGGGRTDAEGRYDLGPWPLRARGTAKVSFYDLEHQFGERLEIAASPGDVVELPDTQPIRPGRVRGTIVLEGGGPATRAVVHSRRRVANVRPDGSFELDGVPVGEHLLRVDMKDGHPFVCGPRVKVKPGQAVDGLMIVVGGLLSIRGRVVDGHGKPRLEVTVAAVPQAAGSYRSEREAWAVPAEDGTFELKGLRPGTYRVGVARLHRRLGEYFGLQRQVRVQEVEAGADDVRVVVAVAGVVTGQVVDAGDKFPRVSLVARTGPTEFDRFSMGDGFRGEVLKPGRYRIEVKLRGRATFCTKAIEMRDGQTLDLGKFRLGPPSSIAGVVRDAEGQRVRHAKMHFIHEQSGALLVDYDHMFSDAAGRFECGDLPAGSYTVLGMAPGHALALLSGVKVKQGGRVEVVLAAPAAARLVVDVRDTMGKPVTDAELRYRPEGLGIMIEGDFRTYEPRSYGAYKSDGAGQLRKPLMRPGRVEFVVETKDGRTARGDCVLRAGTESRVQLVVK